MAVDSLRSVAGLLSEAYGPLQALMGGRSDVPEAAALDTFFTTVKATADVRALCPLTSTLTVYPPHPTSLGESTLGGGCSCPGAAL